MGSGSDAAHDVLEVGLQPRRWGCGPGEPRGCEGIATSGLGTVVHLCFIPQGLGGDAEQGLPGGLGGAEAHHLCRGWALRLGPSGWLA